MAHLDLTKLPVVSNRVSLLRYNPFDEFPSLADLGEISERIYGCNKFTSGKSDEDYPTFLEKANLRAALNELVSLSEMLRAKYPNAIIDKTDLPLLHFFKELRVTNFHIKTFNYGTTEGETVLIGSDGVVGKETYPSSYFIIADCNLNLFTDNLNYKKHYNSHEFERTVEWVATNQEIWGIAHLVEVGLRQYCELIENTIANTRDCGATPR
ncbi:MAG: hypothetical protein K9J06_03970 [Flavobacteriales bacterium]|nr:hypothetical protein [Flavobacteriales bacterium]